MILWQIKVQIKNFEVTVKRFDKTEACISFSGTLFSDIGHVEGVLIDVTERKRLEAKQLRAQRMESIGVLASGMAHDLKNLLVNVRIGTELLQKTLKDKDGKTMLASITLSAEQSINLVQQVLAFVRGVYRTICAASSSRPFAPGFVCNSGNSAVRHRGGKEYS